MFATMMATKVSRQAQELPETAPSGPDCGGVMRVSLRACYLMVGLKTGGMFDWVSGGEGGLYLAYDNGSDCACHDDEDGAAE